MLLLVDVSGYLSQVQYILSPLFGIGPRADGTGREWTQERIRRSGLLLLDQGRWVTTIEIELGVGQSVTTG